MEHGPYTLKREEPLIIVCAQNLTKISFCLIILMYEAHVLIHAQRERQDI